MFASSARVHTQRAKHYLEQLCEHFADERRRHSDQEFDVTVDGHEGLIDFAPVVSGTCRLDAREEGVLVLSATGTEQAALERVQRIVTKHVERFGEHDALTVEWGPVSKVP